MKNILLIVGVLLLALGLYMQFGAPAFDDAWPTWSAWAAIGLGLIIAAFALLGTRRAA